MTNQLTEAEARELARLCGLEVRPVASPTQHTWQARHPTYTSMVAKSEDEAWSLIETEWFDHNSLDDLYREIHAKGGRVERLSDREGVVTVFLPDDLGPD